MIIVHPDDYERVKAMLGPPVVRTISCRVDVKKPDNSRQCPHYEVNLVLACAGKLALDLLFDKIREFEPSFPMRAPEEPEIQRVPFVTGWQQLSTDAAVPRGEFYVTSSNPLQSTGQCLESSPRQCVR